jgi:ribosomal protein S18 acetylase RimI-like enzyme
MPPEADNYVFERGGIHYSEEDGPAGTGLYIHEYWIDEPFREQGLGKRYFWEWLSHFDESTPVYLCVTEESKDFWEKLGFRRYEDDYYILEGI